MSLKNEGNDIAKTSKHSTSIHNSHDSSFDRKFSLLLMDNSFCDDFETPVEIKSKPQSFKTDNSHEKQIVSKNTVTKVKATFPNQKLSKNQHKIKEKTNESIGNCFSQVVNYNLVLSQYPAVQIQSTFIPQQLQYVYPKSVLIPTPMINNMKMNNPINPSFIYQNSYFNNGNCPNEVLNILDYFYKAFNVGQLTNFLCNSQTCIAYPEFKQYIKGLNQSSSDKLLDMILLSGGLDRLIINDSSSSIIRSLLLSCSSSLRFKFICSISKFIITISQTNNGGQTLTTLFKCMKNLNEIELTQNLLAESALKLSTHKVSYIIVIQFLGIISEKNRQYLNNTLIKLFIPLVQHKYGNQVVSLILNHNFQQNIS